VRRLCADDLRHPERLEALDAELEAVARPQQFHASLILGFADVEARENFLGSSELERISARLQRVASGIHAYDASEALTFVKNGAILPKYQS
jgi:hypothetical protein